MLGVVYLIISTLVGKEAAAPLLGSGGQGEKETPGTLWVTLPASFGVGTLLLTWAVYIIAWLASVGLGQEKPLFMANLLVMGVSAAGLVLLYWRRWRKGRKTVDWEGEISCKIKLVAESCFFLLLFCFVGYMMFYTFHIHEGKLYSGFTVYGDYAPHTAMMRSFSWGNNFPTQYPHFGGEDVKYHFMFQFLAGNLEYLGMSIDWAYNSVSTLSLVGFYMMLYALGERLLGKAAAGVLGILFTIFRSGTAFFRFAWEHFQAGDLLRTLQENTVFIGYTPNENWGIWNFNVYLNQRHFAFGLILVCLVVWRCVSWLEAGDAHEERGLLWLKNRCLSKAAWKSRNLEQALLMGLILGFASFWNGAAVIGGLLILFGFAAFSDGKLDYLALAVATVVLSLLQSRLFVRGSVVKPSFYWGFLAESKSLTGVLAYLFLIGGLTMVGTAVLVFFLKRKERAALLAFLLPLVFAFTMSLTPDINVNHKYVMITWAFLNLYWGWAVAGLWKKGILGKAAALVLALFMTVTGIYDFVVILKDNGVGHRVVVEENGNLSRWLSENLDHEDLILTPEYSIHEATMSGAMLYLGWPYYAWSAGYDTYYRAGQAVVIYTTEDEALLRETVKKEGITYILYEEGMEFEQQECREDVIASCYPQVYVSEDGRIRIYETESNDEQ